MLQWLTSSENQMEWKDWSLSPISIDSHESQKLHARMRICGSVRLLRVWIGLNKLFTISRQVTFKKNIMNDFHPKAACNKSVQLWTFFNFLPLDQVSQCCRLPVRTTYLSSGGGSILTVQAWCQISLALYVLSWTGTTLELSWLIHYAHSWLAEFKCQPERTLPSAASAYCCSCVPQSHTRANF